MGAAREATAEAAVAPPPGFATEPFEDAAFPKQTGQGAYPAALAASIDFATAWPWKSCAPARWNSTPGRVTMTSSVSPARAVFMEKSASAIATVRAILKVPLFMRTLLLATHRLLSRILPLDAVVNQAALSAQARSAAARIRFISRSIS